VGPFLLARALPAKTPHAGMASLPVTVAAGRPVPRLARITLTGLPVSPDEIGLLPPLAWRRRRDLEQTLGARMR